MALLGRLAVPSAGFGVIDASKVHLSEGELRVGVVLINCFAIPSDGFDMALLGRLAVPSDGFDEILRHAFAGGVHAPEVVLRVGVPLFGG